MKESNLRDQTEFAELSKLINKKKLSDIRNYIPGKIEEALKHDHSMKSVRRKLRIGQGKMCKLSDIRNYIVGKIEEALKHDHSMKSVRRKLRIGQGKMCARKYK